jgi:hypothetical protein
MARGRKSAAALSVVAGTIDGRPQAPSDLTEFQRDVWQRTVASEAATFFKTAALQAILKQYCRHVETADVLTRQIDKFQPEWLSDSEGLATYGELLKLRERETRAVATLATKLRLTNQARYVPQAAATAAKSASAPKKPWEIAS